jgi:hypothetical protein
MEKDQDNEDNQDNEVNESKKNIKISGTQNRYLIKRANRVKNELVKRDIINKYNINEDFFNYETQLQLMKETYNKSNQQLNAREKKIFIQEVEKKISNYKQQDLLKKKYNETLFIDIDCILKKLIEVNMQCFYCKCQLYILYKIARELTQWTVDRINNDEGHNKDNFVISCLNCNIKRRNTNSSKFLFTKQLKLVKKDEF